MTGRLIASLATLAVGVLLLLQGLDEIDLSPGIAAAAVLAAAGVVLLAGGLADDDSDGAER